MQPETCISMVVQTSHTKPMSAHTSAAGTPVRSPSHSSPSLLKRHTDQSKALSPWTALEYCQDVNNVEDTWTCHAPESCGCSWNASESLLVLSPRGCKEMGTDARVALYAPSTLAPFVSLPSTVGGPKTYYSGTTINGTSTWVSTAILGCKCDLQKLYGWWNWDAVEADL